MPLTAVCGAGSSPLPIDRPQTERLTSQRVVGGEEEAHAGHALRATPLQWQAAGQVVALQITAGRVRGREGAC